MRTRISKFILLVVIFQMLTSAAVLIFGGEFRDLKEYSYHALVEKTENRSTYIRNEMQGKSVIVQGTAEQLNSVAAAGLVSNLLRTSKADSAYLVLDTGDPTALYLDLENDESGQIQYFALDPEDTDTFDFYHDFGDDYIKTAAKALRKFQDHGGIVSRMSGDEFNICLPGFSSKECIREIIVEVRDELLHSSCMLADGTHFRVGASMGVSWYPDDADTFELLMKYADFAMYTIKHSTKGEIAEFDISSYSTDSVLLTGVEEMNRIIEECSVRYAFQSIISAKTGEVYGYEALMRVQSDIFRSPLELLRAAKTGAKLFEIERLTWTKALADFQALIDAGRIENTAHVFVSSIANHKVGDDVVAMLENTYPHLLNRIVMEILESEGSNEDSIAHKEQVIRRWGGQIALDDFGTGYNSEYTLLSLQPNIIKIDRSIINGCDHDLDRRMIIENLVKLAKARGVFVLAEGVETQEEMQTVISCGVDFLQGYYLAHPMFDPEPLAPEIAELIQHSAAGRSGEFAV